MECVGRPAKTCSPPQSAPDLRPYNFGQQAHDQAKKTNDHSEILGARRMASLVLVRVARRPERGVVLRCVPHAITALRRGADQVQGSEHPVAE